MAKMGAGSVEETHSCAGGGRREEGSKMVMVLCITTVQRRKFPDHVSDLGLVESKLKKKIIQQPPAPAMVEGASNSSNPIPNLVEETVRTAKGGRRRLNCGIMRGGRSGHRPDLDP
ncbi:hypothetical protein L2E82_08099 [Cichorium intybus]|uniref:Uncharacterized protein n=1 Tax=Cichorium intybus TaxID=13427 RepID=A0ACB9G684_CICIN|nr:hypothetical protein L2E82_08099 [Cichorium intybus]